MRHTYITARTLYGSSSSSSAAAAAARGLLIRKFRPPPSCRSLSRFVLLLFCSTHWELNEGPSTHCPPRSVPKPKEGIEWGALGFALTKTDYMYVANTLRGQEFQKYVVLSAPASFPSLRQGQPFFIFLLFCGPWPEVSLWTTALWRWNQRPRSSLTARLSLRASRVPTPALLWRRNEGNSSGKKICP